MKEKLTGQRITLERPAPDMQTAQAVYSAIDGSRDVFAPWLDFVRYTEKAEDTLHFLQAVNQNWNNGTEYVYAIYHQGTFIGLISAINISRQHKRAEIGYWLDAAFSGKGFMTEAVSVLEKELFEDDFNRIIIQTDVLNIKSANVACRCGYVHEGVLRQERYSEIQGRFRDTNVFSKLKFDLKEGGI